MAKLFFQSRNLPLLLTGILILTLLAAACKKTRGANQSALVGHWKYINSTVDSLVNGQWIPPQTEYDSTYAAIFADTLQFTADDKVYYTTGGATFWSMYKVQGNSLILVGSSTNDTLIIHSLSNTQLQIGTQNAISSYWANFTRF